MTADELLVSLRDDMLKIRDVWNTARDKAATCDENVGVNTPEELATFALSTLVLALGEAGGVHVGGMIKTLQSTWAGLHESDERKKAGNPFRFIELEED